MADIKIEKKGGSLWWIWALIALVVIGILLWVFLDNDRGTQVAQAPAVVAAPANTVANTDLNPVDGMNATTQPIADLATITGNTDNSLVGRDVNLNKVSVGDVVGDASFWINGADGKKVYVILNEVKTPGTPIEGRVNVNKGDQVDLTGTIRSASDGVPAGAAIGTKTDPLPAGVDKYIYAQSAKVVS